MVGTRRARGQGFALGGQLSGSYVIMVEAAPEGQRGFYGSLVTVAASCGAALASGCVAATAAALSAEQMAAWGWRLPFVLGGVLAPTSIVAALWFAPDDSSAAERPAALVRGAPATEAMPSAPATEATFAAAASPVRVRPGLSKSDTQPSALLAGRKTKTKFWG